MVRMTTLVLVDDEPDIRFLLRIYLSNYGFEIVGEADNGDTCLDVCRRLLPDAVVLDLNMPVSGLDALPVIKGDCPGTSVVVYSAAMQPEVSRRAMQLGADAAVDKAAGLAILSETIRVSTAGTIDLTVEDPTRPPSLHNEVADL